MAASYEQGKCDVRAHIDAVLALVAPYLLSRTSQLLSGHAQWVVCSSYQISCQHLLRILWHRINN